MRCFVALALAAFFAAPAAAQTICKTPTARVTAVGTSAAAVPSTPLIGRAQITICNSDENSGTPILKCRADGSDPEIGAAYPGDFIRKGACWIYYAPSGLPIKCIADTLATQVTSTECVTAMPLPFTVPPATSTVSSPVTADQGTAGASAWLVTATANTDGKTSECLITATAGGTACPATVLTGRRAVKLTNNGPNAIWCALGSSVPVVGIGDPIQPTGWITYEGSMSVTCIAETADQVTTAATIASEIGQ